MRLSNKEIRNIQESLSTHLKEIPHRVYLFGSRLDDAKRGGDVDLLLLVSQNDFAKAYSLKSILKFDLEGALGDQKVDLTLATEQSLKDDLFLSSIADEMKDLEDACK